MNEVMETEVQNETLSESRVVYRRQNGDSISAIGSSSDKWDEAIDQLLRWHSSAEPEDAARIESAIDYLWDERHPDDEPPNGRNKQAPTSMSLEEGEGVHFEWRTTHWSVLVSAVGVGRFEYTLVSGGRVIETYDLERDPRTRRIEVATIDA